MTTVGEVQKFLEFETAFQQFQLDYAIPYPDKTMDIVEEFFTAFDQGTLTNKEVFDAEDEDEEIDAEDEASSKIGVADAVKSPATKKSFFGFGV